MENENVSQWDLSLVVLVKLIFRTLKILRR